VRLPRLSFLAASLCVAASSRAAPLDALFAREPSFDDRVKALFRPPLGDVIALSPDGKRVAYTAPRGTDLSIVIMDVEPPGPKRTIKVAPEGAPPAAEDQPPLQLRFLRWATANRLVYAPVERVVPLPPVTDKNGRLVPDPDGPTIVSPILVTDADGRQRGTLIDASNFQETPAEAIRTLGDLLRTPKELAAARHEPIRWRMPHLDIAGFFPRDREQLIVQTHGGYSMPMLHLVDIRTGSVREFGDDWATPPAEPQVYDWFWLKVVGERKDGTHPTTAWRDGDLARVQHELETKFPRRIVELLDWSDTRTRVLFRVTGGSDPGRYFVYQRRPEDLVVEILHRAPWLAAAKLNETRFFEFAAPDGARLSGYLTWPAKPRVASPPLLVIFPSGFPGHAQPPFDPEAQVFADLGFVVARLNHRSVEGVAARDLNALHKGIDRIAVDDARAAIDWLAAWNPARPFDRTRVVTLGRGFGGYLAVRALQLAPGAFRCSVAIDAPMDLRAWLQPPAAAAATVAARDIPATFFDPKRTDWGKLSVLGQAETLTAPVMLLVEPARNPAVDISATEMRARLTGLGRPPEYLELDPGFAAARPASRAAAYRKIGEFLNVNLHGYAVKIGATKEVE
jgi:dipeptidyl aminopeptidase/acylaminoacyl peptidase